MCSSLRANKLTSCSEIKGWRQIKLGEVISVKHGWAFKSDFFVEEGSRQPILVNIGNFKYEVGFRFESTRTKEYSGEYPAE